MVGNSQIKNWRLLYTPDKTGAYNMAADKYFLEKCEGGDKEWVLRFYTWKPWCFSLGNAQKPEQELFLDKVLADDFTSVKRMTGGRVVFHAHELTYSIIGPLGEVDWTTTLASTYQVINEILLEGLKAAGFEAQLEKGDVSDTFNKNGANKPCFSSTSRSELVYNKKKIVGSAQRRLRNAFIQHGSILIGPDHLRVADYLKTPDPEAFRAQLAKNSAYLNEQKPCDETTLLKSLQEAFLKAFKIDASLKEITTLEHSEIEIKSRDFNL